MFCSALKLSLFTVNPSSVSSTENFTAGTILINEEYYPYSPAGLPKYSQYPKLHRAAQIMSLITRLNGEGIVKELLIVFRCLRIHLLEQFLFQWSFRIDIFVLVVHSR